MKPRKVPIKHKNTPHIFSVHLEKKGMHHFRVPNAGTRKALSTLLIGVDYELIQHIHEANQAGAEQKIGIKELKKLAMADAAIGTYAAAVVGAYWAHETQELEMADRSILLADADIFADNVYAELEHEGYTPEEITLLYNACMEHTPKSVTEQEVAATADFLPPGGDLSSSPSTMASTIAAETPALSGS